MFLAQLPIVELQYQDETGSKAAMQLRMPIGSTVETGDANAVALASLLASITGCALVRTRIIYKAYAELMPEPSIGSSIVRSGVFVFESDDTLSQVLVQVPGILDDVLATDGPGAGVLIDTANSDVAAFIEAFQASGMTNPFAVLCTALVAAYRQSRL